MKNALLLLGLWVGIVLFAYGVVYWDGGAPFASAGRIGDASVAIGEAVRVPVPAGWSVEADRAALRLMPADSGLVVAVACLGEVEPAGAARRAWAAAYGAAAPPVRGVIDAPAAGPAASRVTFEPPGEAEAAYAVVWSTIDGAIVLLVKGTITGMERLADDVEGIAAGILLRGVPLRTWTPAPVEL